MEPIQILYAAFLFLGGWLWAYLFVRQFIYNFTVALPLIKKIQQSDKSLIADTSKKYTYVSIIANFFVCAIIAAIVLLLLRSKLYLLISFLVGGIVAIASNVTKLKISNRSMFEAFCTTYYRFVPDDELRTAMFNKKFSQMKVRLHEMGYDYTFIPKFDD